MNHRSTTLEVAGLSWATSTRRVEQVLAARPGVHAVNANAATQTATVTFDPALTSVAELAAWVRDCGFHCAGASVPDHVCDPLPAHDHATHPDHAASPPQPPAPANPAHDHSAPSVPVQDHSPS